jgi:hypothetical protein
LFLKIILIENGDSKMNKVDAKILIKNGAKN